MRRSVTAAALALALAASPCLGIAHADTASAPPYEAVRAITALQDRIANGDTTAQAAHARTILRTGHAFAKADPALWMDKRNARALVVFLFSGGDAQEIGDAIPSAKIAPDVADIYRGALAYGSADDATARAKLTPIDAKALPSALGGHLALVQATLLATSEPAKAITLLDLARLLEPGTLVEEAALRKEMSLIGAKGDLEKFALLTRRYLNVFARSSYAENFRELVARRALEIGADDTPEAAARLGRLMMGLDANERRKLYLAIAHVAVVAGRTTMATLASEAARKIGRPDDPDASRALVYYGAAGIVGGHYDAAKAALASVDANRLKGADRMLHTTALQVAQTIREPLRTPSERNAKAIEAALSQDAERSLTQASAALTEASR